VLDLARLLEVSVELLAAIATVVLVPAAGFQQLAPAIRQNDGDVPAPFEGNRTNQAFVSKMPEITSAWIAWAAVMVREVSTRNHPKRADRAQRPRLGAAKFVLVVAIADDFAFEALRQIEVVREDVAGIDGIAVTVARVIVAIARILSPTGIVHAGPLLPTT
jgi:predicted protein tyrosine phosphatase